jgi:OOP family OmpA-OmpF porin
MIKNIYIIFILSSVFRLHSQTDFNGVWQGLMIRDGFKNEQASILFADFKTSNGLVEGKTRDEIFDTDHYAVKKIKGSCKDEEITFNEFVIEKKKSSSKTNWCNIDAVLVYNDSSGYLEGRYTSNDCKRNTGKVILYRSKVGFSVNDIPSLSHSWFMPFINDLKKGYNAPLIRDEERKNFRFQPIYFDHDKAEIKPEYIDFLIKMARVVDGHTDLRIKVTGHTDSDGSDLYNIDLSKRRAYALIDFFVAHGLNKDRIEIDFKGENSPIDNNKTPEGKQHNRRVDFAFI